MGISEQVKELRELSENPEIDMYGILSLQKICREAADTIESLAEKLRAGNTDRAVTNYENEIMTLDEAIKHLDDVLQPDRKWECEECRNEHVQLREWLIELRQRRGQTK